MEVGLVEYVWRATIMYFITILALRLMGKRIASRVSPHDLVILITIGGMVRFVINEPSQPIESTIYPLAALVLLHLLVSLADSRWKWVADFFNGQPTLLVRDGLIQERNLKKTLYGPAALWSQLRSKGVGQLGDVREAYLEPSGNFSVIKQEQAKKMDLDMTQSLLDIRLQRIEALLQEMTGALSGPQASGVTGDGQTAGRPETQART